MKLHRMLATMGLTLALGDHLVASDLAAESRWIQRVERARAKVLAAPLETIKDPFEKLVDAVRAAMLKEDLPKDAPNTYGEEYQAWRAKNYDPLKEDPECLEYLLQVLLMPDTVSLTPELEMVVYAADTPTVDHAYVLLDGLRACSDKTESRFSRSRHVGRCIRALENSDEPGAYEFVEEALAFLRQDLEQNDSMEVKGCAIEGMYWAGKDSEAHGELQRFFHESGFPAGDVMELLYHATRLMRTDDVDEAAKSWAMELAETMAADSLEQAPEAMLDRVVSREATLYQYAYYYMQVLAPEKHLEELLTPYHDYAKASLLGMDDLSYLRTTLQTYRRGEERDHDLIDECFLSLVFEAGERLQLIAEEPMTLDERKDFHTLRDIRYNALYYFVSLWDRVESIREWWDEDSVETLHAIVHSDEEQVSGEGHDRLYHGFFEKTENRVLAMTLLCKMKRDSGIDPQMDLRGELLEVLFEEVKTPVAAAESARQEMRGGEVCHVAIGATPDDDWIQDKILDAYELLGARVDETAEQFVFTFPASQAPAD